jgi:poly-gamma-glutamate synthesis protein (capsule biosynthesis protein)
VADTSDRDELLDAIAAARADADVIVVAIHSHEPGNLSQVPATFVRDFAHQTIERGATVVVGTGPRQLRGIEVYRGRPIFYSLGNFAFDAASIPLGAADVFDANTNLTDMALGQAAPPRLPTYDEAMWWESVVATTTFGDDGTIRIRLDPIDLGADAPLTERGRPRLASRDRGAAILQRLATLSKPYGTIIGIEDGAGTITIPARP